MCLDLFYARKINDWCDLFLLQLLWIGQISPMPDSAILKHQIRGGLQLSTYLSNERRAEPEGNLVKSYAKRDSELLALKPPLR
jgi:hypothetical protein